MTEIRKKAEGFARQIVGEMIGDNLLVEEGRQEQREAEQASEANKARRDTPPSPQLKRTK